MSEGHMHVVSALTTREKGGAEYACVDLLSALAARGHQVSLLTNMPELAESSNLPTRKIDLGPKLARATVVRVMIGFLPATVRLAAALRRERARSGPVDVLLVHFKKEQLMAPLLPRRLAGSVAWAEWGPLPAAFTRGIPKLLYRLASRRARTVLAVSESTRRSLIEAGIAEDKIELIPNRVDASTVAFDPGARGRLRAEWGAGEDTFVVGCVGRLHPKKRAHVLIEAMTHVNAPGDVLLVLAGEGDEEPMLRRLAAEHSVPVRFLPTPRNSVQAVLSAFDVALFAPAPTEGAPQSIVLAQLTGRPVIATDRPGAEELIVPGTGMIADPPQDPRAVAACIDGYRRDQARREQEGLAARKHAFERHDQSRVDPKVESALERAAAH